MSIDFIFKTWFVAIWCISIGIIYCLTLWKQKRINDIEILDFFAVAFASASFIGGFKLIYSTFVIAYKDSSSAFNMDLIYTMLGGFAVMWLSTRTFISKIRTIKDSENNN